MIIKLLGCVKRRSQIFLLHQSLKTVPCGGIIKFYFGNEPLDSDSLDIIVLIARLGERAAIVFLVLVTSILFMRVYRDRIQQIDLNVDAGDTKSRLVATFSMPVFLLLTLVVFAFVAFSNPVRYERISSAGDANESEKQVPDPGSNGSVKIGFVGIAGTVDEQREWVGALGAVGESLAKLDLSRQDGLIDDPQALAAIERAFLVSGDIVMLRLALLDELHPEGNPQQNCLQFTRPGAEPPNESCASYVEDYQRGLQ